MGTPQDNRDEELTLLIYIITLLLGVWSLIGAIYLFQH